MFNKIYGAHNHQCILVQQHVAELYCISCKCVCSQHKCTICMVHIHPHGLIVNFSHKSCLSVTGCTLKYYSFHGLVYFHLLLSGDVELNPGPKRFSDVTKFKACISEWKCFMFLFFIILSMFIFDHVLTYPFRTLCMQNSSCNSTESNFRQHFELNLHHVVRICPNLINMTHQVLISVAKRSRQMMFKQYLSKRSYFYARLLLLLLLLAGDVESNPGPIQDVIKEHCLQSESITFIGDKTKAMLQGQDSKTSSKDDCERKRRLEQFAESQRKHREKESVEQRDM